MLTILKYRFLGGKQPAKSVMTEIASCKICRKKNSKIQNKSSSRPKLMHATLAKFNRHGSYITPKSGDC